jgi:hypothetical protein
MAKLYPLDLRERAIERAAEERIAELWRRF